MNKKKANIILIGIIFISIISYLATPYIESYFFDIERSNPVKWEDIEIPITKNIYYMKDNESVMLYFDKGSDLFVYIKKIAIDISSANLEEAINIYFTSRNMLVNNFSKYALDGESVLVFEISASGHDGPNGGLYIGNRNTIILYNDINQEKKVWNIISGIKFIK